MHTIEIIARIEEHPGEAFATKNATVIPPLDSLEIVED